MMTTQQKYCNVTPTLIWYYYICPREVWLISHGINPEHDNHLLELGRFFHEHSYQRGNKEISVDGMRLDILKNDNGRTIICEIKKTSKFELASKMQLIYSMYKLKTMGINVKGELLVPREKKKTIIELDEKMEQEIKKAVEHIKGIMNSDKPIPPVKIKYCRACAYRYFCWA